VVFLWRRVKMGDLIEAKVRVWTWSQYMGKGDWLHDVVLSSAARIADLAKVPQPLFEITSDVDPGAVSFFDWMAGTNDVSGYGLLIQHRIGATLQMIVNLKFKLVDFSVGFSDTETKYGYSNVFTPDLEPKAVVDAFWGGGNRTEITDRLDVALHGFLNSNEPIVGRV
jgi:hypothetical protein